MIAFVFPGQGSQVVGMGKDIADAYPMAAKVFEQADSLLGFKLSELCFEGPQAVLDDTINTQPALYATSIATLRVIEAETDLKPHYVVAGHSLGEFTALTAADALTFDDGLRLVRERGRLMKEAGEKQPGAMAAILALDVEVVKAICEQATAQVGEPVVLANDNCPGQVVISGEMQALDVALKLAEGAGARRSVRLAVSIAAHSPLMQSAATEFQSLIESTPLNEPQVPIFANVTAQPLNDVDALRDELNRQLTSTVRWTDSMRGMIDAGVTQFVEIGSGDVLTGMTKRIDRSRERVALNTAEALSQFIRQSHS